jgi:hypothetical protein
MDKLPKDIMNIIDEYAEYSPAVLTVLLFNGTIRCSIAFMHIDKADEMIKMVIRSTSEDDHDDIKMTDTHYIKKSCMGAFIRHDIEELFDVDGSFVYFTIDRCESWLSEITNKQCSHGNELNMNAPKDKNFFDELDHYLMLFDNMYF